MKGSEQLLGILGLSSHQANNLLIHACRKGVHPKKKKPTALNHLRELDCTHSIYIVSSMDHKVLNICMQHAKKKKKIKTEYKVKLLVSILVHLDPQLHLTVVLRAHLPVPVLTRGTIFCSV